MGKELLGSLELNRAYQMDCLEGMKLIPDGSVDMILCDLPYGTTQCKWDTVIPFEPLWEQYKRLIKDTGAIVLTSSQPFTTALINSNLEMFRYCWVWDKKIAGNPMLAKHQPLKIHEDVCVFSKKRHNYYPIMRKGKMRKKGGGYSKLLQMEMTSSYSDEYYPVSILEFSNAKRGVHPTQKPLELFEYLIKTYSKEDEIILDNCLGSGTTAVASTLNNRKWIGFETEREYIELINKRLDQIQVEDDLSDYE